MTKNRLNYQNIRPDKPIAVCGFQQHPEGKFQINGRLFRPTWPHGSPLEMYNLAEEIIDAGLNTANKVYSGREGLPQRVRVEVYQEERMRIIIRE